MSTGAASRKLRRAALIRLCLDADLGALISKSQISMSAPEPEPARPRNAERCPGCGNFIACYKDGRLHDHVRIGYGHCAWSQCWPDSDDEKAIEALQLAQTKRDAVNDMLPTSEQLHERFIAEAAIDMLRTMSQTPAVVYRPQAPASILDFSPYEIRMRMDKISEWATGHKRVVRALYRQDIERRLYLLECGARP